MQFRRLLHVFFVKLDVYFSFYWESLKSVKQSAVFDHLLEINCSVNLAYLDVLVSHAR